MAYFKDTIKGVTWVAGFRYSTRALTLVKTVVLAKYFLTPYQFGLFGIAAVVLALLEILTETGINVFLIQHKQKIEEYINSAWIVSIVRGIFVALLIVLFAAPIAHFFNAGGAYNLLLLLSIVPFIRGFINPAIIRYQKELEFHKDFYLRFSIFTVDLIATLLFAMLFHDATSLVWGLIAGCLCEVILSFVFIKPLPRLAFESEKVKTVLNKGKWVTISGIFTYLSQEGDNVVVGKLAGITSLGYYQMAYKFSTLPITEITEVVHKVVFPVYTKISHERTRLLRAFTKTSVLIIGTVLVLGLVLYIFAGEIVLLILGKKWIEIIPVLKILVTFGVLRAIFGSTTSLFLAVGKQNYVAIITSLRFFAMGLSIIPLTIMYGMVGAGYSLLISALVEMPITIYYVIKVFKNDQTHK